MRPCGHVSSASDLIDLSRLGPPVDRFGVFSMSLLISPNETISSIMYGCTPTAPPLCPIYGVTRLHPFQHGTVATKSCLSLCCCWLADWPLFLGNKPC